MIAKLTFRTCEEQESGVRSQESEGRSQKSGVMSQKPQAGMEVSMIR
jgi:hypothetical protein